MNRKNTDRHQPVDLEALSDLATPWCLRAVVTLGIPQLMGAGVTDVDELARASGCDAAVLATVLAQLAARDVLAKLDDGGFVLNNAAQDLLEPAHLLSLNLEGIGGRMALAWGTVLTYLRTGQPEYAKLFGHPFWEDLEVNPDIGASFEAFMAAVHGRPEQVPPISGGWGSVRSVVDVGGGTGHVLAQLLRAHRDLRGTLVDLPATVARSAPTFAEAGVSDRVVVVGQSFFDPLPKHADVYLLRSVLNDWPDQDKLAILRRCAEAASSSGRILVAGGVRPAGAPEPISIDKILTGGNEAPIDLFRDLAREAGLMVSTTQEPPTGHLIVECHLISSART